MSNKDFLHPFSIFIYDENIRSGKQLAEDVEKEFPFCHVTFLFRPEEAAGVLILKRFHIFILYLRAHHKNAISSYSLKFMDAINCLYPQQKISLIAISPFEHLIPKLYTHHYSYIWDIGFTQEYAITQLKEVISTLSFLPQDDHIFLFQYPYVSNLQVQDLIYTDHSYRQAVFYFPNQKIYFHNKSLQEVMKQYHPYGFMQCNRFQVVNLAHIEKIHDKGRHKHLVLKNHMGTLNVGDSYLPQLVSGFELFKKHLI